MGWVLGAKLDQQFHSAFHNLFRVDTSTSPVLFTKLWDGTGGRNATIEVLERDVARIRSRIEGGAVLTFADKFSGKSWPPTMIELPAAPKPSELAPKACDVIYSAVCFFDVAPPLHACGCAAEDAGAWLRAQQNTRMSANTRMLTALDHCKRPHELANTNTVRTGESRAEEDDRSIPMWSVDTFLYGHMDIAIAFASTHNGSLALVWGVHPPFLLESDILRCHSNASSVGWFVW
jgi:hypothetical protein